MLLLFIACFQAQPVDYPTYVQQAQFFSDTGPVLADTCSEPFGEPRDVTFINKTDQSISIDWVDGECMVEPWSGLMFIDASATRLAQPGEVYRIMSASTLIDFIPQVLDERVLDDVDLVEVTL